MRLVSLLIPAVLLVAPPDSADLKKGIAAYEARNGQKVVELLTPLAEKGNARAQYYLGLVYTDGPTFFPGVELNKELGLDWLKKAADLGVAEAQYQLGVTYIMGRDLPLDMEAGMVWVRKAAIQGHVPAMGCMGNACKGDPDYAGSGIRANPKEALAWYRKAARKGDGFSMGQIGDLYKRGSGVPQDYIEAHAWLNLAASQKSLIPEFYAGQRDTLARRMTATQVAKAQARAKSLTKELGL